MANDKNNFLIVNQNLILGFLGVIAIVYIIFKIIDTIKRITYSKLKKGDIPNNEECHWRHKYKKESGIISYKCTKPFLFSWLRPKQCQHNCKYLDLKGVPDYKESALYYIIDMFFGFILSVAMIVISIITNFIK